MRLAELSGYVKRRKFRTTFNVQGVRVADDLVERDFNPPAPDHLWVTDIKYVSTWEGTLYLASVLDCLLGVTDQLLAVGPPAADRHLDRVDDELGRHLGAHRPADDLAAERGRRPRSTGRRRHSRLGYRSPDQFEREHDSVAADSPGINDRQEEFVAA